MFSSGASEVRERPDTVGWRSVATAIHSMRQLPMPMLLTVVSSDCEPLWVDFSTGRYYWERPLVAMPERPAGVTVYSQPIEPGNPPYPWVSWRSMDPLLWQIGRFAFGTDRATWMRPGDRYALQRWPNLTEIPHTADEIRMIATLANGYLTAGELALLSATDEPTAQRVLNMLSLMGAVKPAAGPLAPPAIVARVQAQPRPAQPATASAPTSFGFFSRLRERLTGGR